MSEPKRAATVMIAREQRGDLELFLVRRSTRSAFMPDIFVFPGGAVDTGDSHPAAGARMTSARDGVDPAFVFAAARETFEEAGVLFVASSVGAAALAAARARVLERSSSFIDVLGDLETVVDSTALHYFSRWITPPTESRRFETCFFVARLPAGQIACADAGETHDGRWLAPSDALARHAAGNLALSLPTIKHLERLRAFARIDALLEYTARKAIHPVMPAAAQGGHFRVPAALEGRW